LEHPEDPTKVLIGYERGLIVMWDLTEQKTVKVSTHTEIYFQTFTFNDLGSSPQHYLYSQQLEDLSWLRMPVDKDKGDSLYFVSGHNDGSYVIWDVNKAEKPFKDATTPYGPYPCKKISKLQLFQEERGEPGGFLMVFAGGMPRAAYGDHYTVTVLRDGPDANGNAEGTHGRPWMNSGQRSKFTFRFFVSGDEGGSPHVVFDLSSRVIDFAVIPGEEEEGSTPAALVILAEEEMVVVDLGREGWPVFHPHPYLNCLHPSALTAFHHVSAPSQEVYDALRRIGREAWEADKISTNVS
jgi:lethal(2) giant larvae protein